MKTVKELWKMVQEADATTAELIPYFGQHTFWVLVSGVCVMGMVLFM